MRALHPAVAAALLLAAMPAAAQLSNHSLAVEAGLSSRPRAPGYTGSSVAVTATRWIEGDVEALARVAFASAARTDGRAAASALSGTLGLRVSLLHDPVRPQLEAEIGWARVFEGEEAEDRIGLGIGAGVEWFPVRDLSLALRIALRGPPAALTAQATFAASVYF